MKRYLWGFPGIGKSSLDVPGLRIVDADSRLFEFKDVSDADLHGDANRSFERDDSYPQNYLDYIQSVDADIVLINCHPSLLDAIDKEDVLLVYPSQWLLTEYFHRYVSRGDNDGFVSYMVAEAAGMIQYLNAMDYEKYQVFTFDIYLSDLFERKDFKMKLMTRQDIINALERAMTLKVIDTNEERGELVFSRDFVTDVPSKHRINDATVWAEAVIDGRYALDIDRLNEVCSAREDELKKVRETLIADFQRAIDLNILNVDVASKTVVCNLAFAADEVTSGELYDAHALADDVMSGKYFVDIVYLKTVCEQREEQLVELQYADRRGGLSRQELADKIMQGIVNGALGIRYDQIAPYSHGYEVTFGGNGAVGSTREFKNRWECYRCGFFDVPGKIVDMIENSQQDGRVFGKKAQPLEIKELLAAIVEMEGKQITSFVLAKDSGFEKRGRYTGHVASVMDVHEGKALDGIVQHYYHGDYSSMTPSRQNDLVETLVFMKGFCLDCLDGRSSDKQAIVDYLKKRGIDVSTPAKLQEWIKANPERCGKEENRALSFKKPSLAAQIEAGASLSGSKAPSKDVDIDRGDER